MVVGSLTANGSANAWSNNSTIASLQTYWFNIASIDANGLTADSVWDVYVFTQDLNQANWSFTVDGVTKTGTDADDEAAQTTWVEDTNFVKFSGVTATGGNINIGRNSGAIIGIQLVSVAAPEPSCVTLFLYRLWVAFDPWRKIADPF
jgi:hypothetical protein